MGVLRLFVSSKNLTDLVSDQYVIKVDKVETEARPTVLFIDANSVAHCIRGLKLEKGEKIVSRARQLDTIWQAYCQIVERVNPSHAIVFSFDGDPPMAKTWQQRSRRYRAPIETAEVDALRRKYRGPPSSSVGQDFNMISPGTEFMEELMEYLRVRIESMREKWSERKVVLDSTARPGEGEHKIFDLLRAIEAGAGDASAGAGGGEGAETVDTFGLTPEDIERVVIYGMDGDLLILSMLNYRPGLCLIREKDQIDRSLADAGKDDFMYLIIGRLRAAIASLMLPNNSLDHPFIQEFLHGKKRGEQRVCRTVIEDLNYLDSETDTRRKLESITTHRAYLSPVSCRQLLLDYCAMVSLVGNDFVPAVPFLKIHDSGLKIMIKAYKIVQLQQYSLSHPTDEVFLVERNRINSKFFLPLCQILGSIESECMKYNRTGRLRSYDYFSQSLKRQVRERELTAFAAAVKLHERVCPRFETKHGEAVREGERGWQKRYYESHFGMGSDEGETLLTQQEICQHYLNGLNWILGYYLEDGCPSWTHVYTHTAAPLMQDLARYASRLDYEVEFVDRVGPLTPLAQLVLILPPSSQSMMLPRCLHDLRLSEPYAPYIPESSHSDLVGHQRVHEARIRLPRIPDEVLFQLVREVERRVEGDPKLMQRNRLSTTSELFVLKSD